MLYQALAAYMKQIKKCAVIMSNLEMEYTIKMARQLTSISLPTDKLIYWEAPVYLPALPSLRASKAGNMKLIEKYTRTVSV
jgi:hypothetical protein